MDYFGVKWDRAFATFAVVTKKKTYFETFYGGTFDRN